MCPLVEMSFGWGVESMSLPLCQPVWNPARGNFRRSLCFGWLSSSSSPVILWSCQAPWALPHSLSTLMGLMGEKTLSRLHQESPNYPIHLHRSPPLPQGHCSNSHLKIPRQVTGCKKKTQKNPHQDTIPRETSPAQTPPSCTVSGISLTKTGVSTCGYHAMQLYRDVKTCQSPI